MDYLDFEIEIGVGSGREYPIAVLRSVAGEARETMRFPFDELMLENKLLALQNVLLRSGGGFRRLPSADEKVVQGFGQALFEVLFVGEVRSRYAVSQREAFAQGKGLRLKLRIQSPILAALPWEFLYDAGQAEYICLSSNTPIIRYIELPQPPRPLTVQLPLRILGMIASPHNLPSLEIEREKQRVEQATKALRADGLVTLTWLPGQTWQDLQRAMRQGPWHIFHFIGHGGFDSVADEGLIAFADSDGQARYLTATHLARLLADHRSLRLVVLNACEGARGGVRDIFSSTAAVLVRRGLPAVLAMQYEITDHAAIELARAFYEAIAEGLPVDMAVGEARKAISLGMTTQTMEWGTPVLYMRAPDGVLFHITQQAASPSRNVSPVVHRGEDDIQVLRGLEKISIDPTTLPLVGVDGDDEDSFVEEVDPVEPRDVLNEEMTPLVDPVESTDPLDEEIAVPNESSQAPHDIHLSAEVDEASELVTLELEVVSPAPQDGEEKPQQQLLSSSNPDSKEERLYTQQTMDRQAQPIPTVPPPSLPSASHSSLFNDVIPPRQLPQLTKQVTAPKSLTILTNKKRAKFSREFLFVSFIIICVIGSLLLLSIRTSQIEKENAVNATETAIAASATAVAFAIPEGWKLVLDDPLHDNTKGYQWDTGSGDTSSCAFNGTYHVIDQKKNTFVSCNTRKTDFSNFLFQVQMTLIKGDCGGLVFRSTGIDPEEKVYALKVCPTSIDLYRYTSDKDYKYIGTDLSSTDNDPQLNKSATLAVLANGSTIKIYINQQLVYIASDSTFTHGQIAVAAENANSSTTEVVYSNAKVWAP